MPIDVTCPCGRKSSVPDQYAGKKGKCPACGAVNIVPTPPPPDDFEPEPATDDDAAVQNSPRSAVQNSPAAGAQPPPKTRVVCRCGKAWDFSGSHDAHKMPCPNCGAPLYVPDRNGKFPWPTPIYEPTIQRVHLVDADMPFGSMVLLILKWTFAAIPAAIVLLILSAVFSSFSEAVRSAR